MSVVTDVLDYWFGPEPDQLKLIKSRTKLWFGKDKQVDREIESRFLTAVEAASVNGLIDGEEPLPQRYLATILLLDQLTRNIYRGDPRAFASDALALRLALKVIDNNYDQKLRAIERVFIYLPLEHSEELVMQDRSVALFKELQASVAEELRPAFAGFVDYAIRHQEIIAEFGRFPHRNQILGRQSTAAEIAFLQQPNSSF
jgi:uncharacterized protein (DUF924 family)